MQRAAYGDLLRAGVKIYEREGVILHTKCVMIDGVWTIIGSSNFDHRSVLFNDEVDAVVLDAAVVQDLERRFADDRAAALAVDERTWRHRSLRERISETFWRSVVSLL
jgi:cardiolipin synthase